jgi:hypothetical protein
MRTTDLGRTAVKKTGPWLTYVAIGGDIIFILWVVRNGIDSGFRGTPPEVASFIGLVALLTLNAVLLYNKRG